eukprot:4634754-Heterocapsa_arctica.AAC.1
MSPTEYTDDYEALRNALLAFYARGRFFNSDGCQTDAVGQLAAMTSGPASRWAKRGQKGCQQTQPAS